jgi:hypothetical protein
MKLSHRGLHRASEDERTVKNGVPETCLVKWLLHSRGVLKDRYAAYLIMARRHISTNRPDTLTQTFFIHQLFPCSQTADHTFGKFELPAHAFGG